MRVEVTAPERYIRVLRADSSQLSQHLTIEEAFESACNSAAGTYRIVYPERVVKVYGILPLADVSPPSVPQGLIAEALSATQIELTWDASTDEVGVAGYQIYRAGVPRGTSATTGFLDSGLTPSTQYSYTVAAFDAAGNNSAQSSAASATTNANAAPVWSDPGLQALTPNVAYSLDLGALVNDADGNPVAIAHVSGTLPTGVTYNAGTKRLDGVPTTVQTVSATFAASDAISAPVNLAISFEVLNADTTAPGVPQGVFAQGISASQITVQWAASSDPTIAGARTSGLLDYRIYRGGLLRATSNGTSYTDNGLAANTQYSYTISARDVAGNESAQSTPSVAMTSGGPVQGFLPQPGFSVTSATGIFDHGVEITITGTGFGVGPTEAYHFAPYLEALAEGATLNGSYGRWRTGTQIKSIDTRIASDPWRGKVCEKIAGQLNSAVCGQTLAAVPPNTWVYMSYWTKRDGRVWDAVPLQGGQHKTLKPASAWNDVNSPDPATEILYSVWEQAPNGAGTNQTYMAEALGNGAHVESYVGFPSYTSTEWIRIEAEFFLGDIDGTPTQGTFGIASRLKGGARVLRFDTTGERITFAYASTNPIAARYLGWQFQNYLGNGYADASTCKHDDHCVQIGSRARIEVTDSPTWGADTVAELQVPVSWSDTEVHAKLNLGGFTSLLGQYVHMILHDGSSRLVGQFIAGAEGNVTISWAAPTTGDTSIDYYRVEWGTVIAGGWGYFVNSTRVQAPQTAVTLLLPAGSYAFRVVTVATDGEESQPYFVGTKTILTETSSLRPAILPPIPAWVATGTIGLRAPHDLSTSGQQFVTPLTSYSQNPTIDIGPQYAGGGFVASTSNRRYLLTTDMVCNGTFAIEIRASNVLIDLNGHTIVYFNQSGPVSSSTDFSKCGIWGHVSASVQGDIEIINGNIIQGAGDVTNTPTMGYGRGANPIRLDSLSNLGGKTVYYRGLYIRHSAKYAGAINHYNTSGPAVVCEYCTFVDEGNLVYLRTNQHAEVRLDSFGNDTEIRYCRFVNSRQVATWAKRVHHCEILVDCWWTNSTGVQAPFYPGVRIHSNNIYIVGTHPQGVFIRDTTGCQVYDNWIESKFTRPGELLPSPTGDIDDVQNRATGITFRFGDDSNLQVYGNTILAWAEDDSVVHPVTSALYDAESRGVFYFKYPTATLANNRFYGNLIAALNVDGAASAMTLGLSGNATGLSFDGNWLVANHTHFWLHDSYGSSLDGNPVIGIGNVIEKVDAHAVYRTNRHGGNATATVTATFNANHWRGGSWPVTNSNFGSGHVITYTNEPAST